MLSRRNGVAAAGKAGMPLRAENQDRGKGPASHHQDLGRARLPGPVGLQICQYRPGYWKTHVSGGCPYSGKYEQPADGHGDICPKSAGGLVRLSHHTLPYRSCLHTSRGPNPCSEFFHLANLFQSKYRSSANFRLPATKSEQELLYSLITTSSI